MAAFCAEAQSQRRFDNRIESLAAGWERLFLSTLAWLKDLGLTHRTWPNRPPGRRQIAGKHVPAHWMAFPQPPLQNVKENALYGSKDAWQIDGRELRRLRESSEIYYGVAGGVSAALPVPVPDVAAEDLSTKEHLNGQLTTVIGPVHVLADNAGRLVAPLGRRLEGSATVEMASISGLNLSYAVVEQLEYLVPDTLVPKLEKIWKRVVHVWRMALIPMVARGNKVAVLNAIGCGAFLNRVTQADQVRHIYALALREVLSHAATCLRYENRRMTLEAVVMCLPPHDEENRRAFQDAFRGYDNGSAVVTVHILTRHDMLSVSAELARRTDGGVCALNPSDAEATRLGRIGMFFDGGHIALEEYIAVATTVLTMNRYLDPDLWNTNRRHRPVNLDAVRCDPPCPTERLERLAI